MTPAAIRDAADDAPAKVNLALHVVGQRPDGYHLIESLVTFVAGVADRVSVTPGGDADTLVVEGRFAASVPGGAGNILLQATAFARDRIAALGLTLPPLAIRLDKRLPVAAGIGGGSADAAALLRIIVDACPAARAVIAAEAVTLGADVPMCLAGRPALVSGIGEHVEALAPLPDLPILLVNPGVAVATPAVFRALASRNNPKLPPLPPEGFRNAVGLAEWLGETRNDLAAPAITIAPGIDRVTAELRATGALFARMSGSGATVFGLFADRSSLRRAGRGLKAAYPSWWVSDPADTELTAA
ncbi:4-(cytidine 5'-diphospho)-2-C-methyl-D-erythritol kinase [Aurantimonas endophytica]|uniref:4-diphosphocytidyl-2-C-methyl-D-erythritol kinase n=1 Tax=Aurantimonas endophytica TaxID=1522175 RepID=A0A7W6MPE8_9HYPH|nr:4-(cytidine 5'-diphospho)-2-C-methyl-D-erythritol kinase [Aurantimonas endophytica]MBB4002940.1 4-diphosphocytidyl-2-C-methyl-D-erythritol kinase [Aurantimonas endophytica]MCO6403816.1 4-(cytidine 5'-diphospho)-2-C-methyl-D-erythritol kinase [Aurantimonas endophytica]